VIDGSGDNYVGLFGTINAAGGSNRWFVNGQGTAPSYFGGTVEVAASGGLGIGTAPGPGSRISLLYDRAVSQGILIRPSADTGAGVALFFQNAAASFVGSITTTASATSFNTSSDVRLKHAIATLTGALDRVRALRPVAFRWNADDSQGHGFLAHELQAVVPEAVTGEPDAVNDDGSIKPQQVDHSKLVPWLTSAAQALLARVETLEAQVAALQA